MVVAGWVMGLRVLRVLRGCEGAGGAGGGGARRDLASKLIIVPGTKYELGRRCGW